VGNTLSDQTRIVTAVSKLARNLVVVAGCGLMTACWRFRARNGVMVTFADQDPGLAQALYRAAREPDPRGAPWGLPGVRSLTDGLALVSEPGEGTVVTMSVWL
jgi:serine/threonine-protein kinase RsbT